MADVVLRGLTKRFGKFEAVKNVDLTVESGEFCVLVGPSGCGKSTLLRMIAGLEEIDGGELSIDGQAMNEVRPADRGVSMVFQSYALYPHMTVYRNMAFGLKLAKTDTDTIDQRVRNAAETLQIEGLLDRRPRELSGGQRQRVAIGRAIVRQPKVFLFDEPLSNLDATLRVQMRLEIARLHQRLGNTVIYVTHDQVEAMTLADKIVVLNGGKVEQIGSPLEVYRKPANLFVAGFIGAPQMNLVPVTVAGRDNGELRLSLGDTTIAVPDASGVSEGDKLTLGMRPDHVQVADRETGLAMRVDLIEELGENRLIHGTVGDKTPLTVRQADRDDVAADAEVPLAIQADATLLFDGNGNRVPRD